MSLQVEKLEKNMAKLTIEVAAEELEKAIESAYQKNKNRISVPGFRKGKAPRKMLEQMYGKEIFYEDAANELVPDAYDKALEECTEEIVSAPKIAVVQLEAGKPFIFTAEVALKPEVTLGQYKGVEVDKVDAEVSDEDVTAEIDRERDKNARMVEITDRPVRDKDVATIDFEGFKDGVAFEGGKGEDYPLTIGSHTFIPGFEEALIGAEIGKETDVNVTFPEDYQEQELAGKAVVFKCTVKKLQEKQLPELDDDFIGDVSEESDTVEEYREEVRKKLSDRKTKEAEQEKENAAIAAAIANAQMEIPDAMVETQQRQMVQDYANRLRYQGLTLEQYMQYTGVTSQMLMDQMKPQALRYIQTRLVMGAVAKAENLEATEEDFEEEVKTMSEAYQKEIDEVKSLLGEEGKKQVMEDICIRKAVKFVAEQAMEVESKGE
jgi:trigger factor